ncbi:MAG: hypothetical protein COB13_006240 [OCS116 cluster bacterium]|nr:hypothetical protein [OCS116 cluster bacterium]
MNDPNGFHQSLIAYANASNNLIVEHILHTNGWQQDLQKSPAPFEVYFVAIHPSLATLQCHEQARSDRPKGSATQDYQTIHNGLNYDLELDCEQPLKDNVSRLLSAWQKRQSSSAFFG